MCPGSEPECSHHGECDGKHHDGRQVPRGSSVYEKYISLLLGNSHFAQAIIAHIFFLKKKLLRLWSRKMIRKK